MEIRELLIVRCRISVLIFSMDLSYCNKDLPMSEIFNSKGYNKRGERTKD